MGSLLFNAVVLVVFCISKTRQDVDYYWRDFYGKVPNDAVPLGKDLNGMNLYVVQAYIHEHGIYFAGLAEEAATPEIACYGVKKPDKLLKILCSGHKNHFGWKVSNKTRFHLDMLDRNPVIGGYNYKGGPNGFLHIGRVTYNGILKICELVSFTTGNVLCYFAHNGKEMSNDSYEVLIFHENIPYLNQTDVTIIF